MWPFDLREMVLRTVFAPREVARELLAWNPPDAARWIGLLLVAVVSVMLGTLGEGMMTMLSRGKIPFENMAFTLAPLQVVIPLIIAFQMGFMGRRFGGQGTFRDALLLTVWMQGVLTLLQAVQVVVMIFFPMTALFAITAMTIALLLYLLTNFTAALHGFENIVATAMGVIVTGFFTVLLTALILTNILVSLGLVPVEALQQ
jgi:hypothetical protein